MSFINTIYRALRVYNDINAIRRGPQAVAKRQVRKAAYRTTNRALRRILK